MFIHHKSSRLYTYETMSSPVETSSPRVVGQVKWFNNKAGYGFITAKDGDSDGTDIFVHYSSIRVANTQYKYLVQGEYVEFVKSKSSYENHEYQASDITGIKGGKLMCEMRFAGSGKDESSESPGPDPLKRTFTRAPLSQPRNNDGFVRVESGRRRQPIRRTPGSSRPTRPNQKSPQTISESTATA